MKKIFLVLLVLGAILQTGCKTSRTSDIIGPAACPSDAFQITTPFVFKNNADNSTSSLDLMASYAKITASFNESITYKLVITGQVSGAVFQAEGQTNALSINWYGNSTNGKYFQKSEVLSYILTNLCKTEPLGQGNITLATSIGYSGFGLKVVNFEDVPAVARAIYGDINSPTYGASNLITSDSASYSPSPQGGNYFHYEAKGTAAPGGINWYFGGMDFTGITYSSLGDDPTNVYLNFFARGKANSQLQILISEVSYGTTLTRKFLANVAPGEWKLYSVRLSDIGIIKPSAISAVNLNIGAAAYRDASAQVDMDLLILTFNKPF